MALLEVTNVSKSFGGVVANDEISMGVERGQIVGLIGPNGSGKTTLFNVITGYHRADSGVVRFRGKDILGRRPHQVNRAGIARTFQKLRPFSHMTVLENVMIGALPRASDVAEAQERSVDYLGFVGLTHKMHALAGTLSTGQRKRLEVARAMATEPELPLLDEPAGGVDPEGVRGLIDLIERMRKEGLTLLVIEHNMKVIMAISDQVVALHVGRKICEGAPSDVVRDAAVIEAYLGESHA